MRPGHGGEARARPPHARPPSASPCGGAPAGKAPAPSLLHKSCLVLSPRPWPPLGPRTTLPLQAAPPLSALGRSPAPARRQSHLRRGEGSWSPVAPLPRGAWRTLPRSHLNAALCWPPAPLAAPGEEPLTARVREEGRALGQRQRMVKLLFPQLGCF
ncbi:hypothetical protein P7K49_027153 [Saguinus oedipus]|uniref:Uncharacterized protein n=1 Tax=Saguinus oedipus TaxID=9490 RepID=A0ABQ9UHI6_SAGOE|nr:hypothetical protein P7K49_027153 [Saguinus oedipus]